MQLERTCAHCREAFRIDPAQLKYKGSGQFCSKRCHYEARKAAPHKNKVTPDGRVLVYAPDSPMAPKSGYVYRYRLVMAEKIGRPLRSDEHVDHLNEIKSDDRPENLSLVSASEHRLRHARDAARAKGYELGVERRCMDCKQVKPNDEFSPSTSRGRPTRSSRCRPCAATWAREYKRKKRNAA